MASDSGRDVIFCVAGQLQTKYLMTCNPVARGNYGELGYFDHRGYGDRPRVPLVHCDVGQAGLTVQNDPRHAHSMPARQPWALSSGAEWPKDRSPWWFHLRPAGLSTCSAACWRNIWAEVVGRQVVVENVTGAGGMTGSLRVAQGNPDGHAFVLGSIGTHALNQTLYRRPLYNAAADFAPVALIADVPLVLITRKDLPVRDLGEFISYAKARQSTMQFGSAGAGTSTHIGCVAG